MALETRLLKADSSSSSAPHTLTDASQVMLIACRPADSASASCCSWSITRCIGTGVIEGGSELPSSVASASRSSTKCCMRVACTCIMSR